MEPTSADVVHSWPTIDQPIRNQLPSGSRSSLRGGRGSAPVQPTPSEWDDAIFGRLLEHRILVLGQEVDDATANRICGELLLLANIDNTADISLYINSPGGSVNAGLAIFDTMEFIECDVVTCVVGLAASMGQFLLSAGTPGKRFAVPHAAILMHQPHAGVGGTASDIEIQAEQFAKLKYRTAELTAAHTGQTVEQILRDADRDRWFTAHEALRYGFVDHVISRSGHLSNAVAR